MRSLLFTATLTIALIANTTVFALTIDRAVDLGKRNNPRLRQAWAKFEIAKSQTFQESWLDQPSLVYNFRQIPVGSSNPANANWYQYGIAQKLPLPHKYWLNRSSFWNQERKYKYLYDQTLWNIRAEIITAYYNLYFAKKKVEINQENKTILERLKKVSEAKYVVGQSNQSDLLSAQIESELIDNSHITYVKELELAKTRLWQVLNYKSSLEAESVPQPFAIDLSLEDLKRAAQESNPELLSLLSSKKAWSDQHLLQKTDWLGDFKVSFLQRETPGAGLTSWDLLFSTEVPIWFWSKASMVSETGFNQDVAKQAYDDFRNELEQKVESVYINFDNARRTEALYKKSLLGKARQALSAAESAYKAGTIDFQSLLKIKKIYFETKLKHYRSLVDVQIYKAKLEALVGREI